MQPTTTESQDELAQCGGGRVCHGVCAVAVRNKLCFGDCLEVLDAVGDDGRAVVADESVDLVYLDPPFNSKADYNMIFGRGEDRQAQMRAFTDTWQWGGQGTRDVEEIKKAVAHPAHAAVSGLHVALGDCGMMAYLGYMAKRLAVVRKKMKPTASVYLHCDPTASHYLKIVMDAVFGAGNFRNEIIWWYRKFGQGGKNFKKNHDCILYYTKTAKFVFNKLYEAFSPKTQKDVYKRVLDEHGKWKQDKSVLMKDVRKSDGVAMGNTWEISFIHSQSKERIGYQTQKPIALLKRIVEASSNPGDLVLDPFCGCGTTIAAAELLRRRWIGIDISAATIRIVTKARKELGARKNYETFGIPKGMQGAKRLAASNRLQYEHWQISTVPGLAPNSRKNQEGFDGRGTFLEVTGVAEGKPPTRTITAEVKSGKGGVSAAQRNHLKAHVEKNKSVMGIFLTLERDRATEKWCKAQGHYQMPGSVKKYPRFQVYSAEHYFQDLTPDLPPMLDPLTGKPVQDEFFAGE